MKAHIVIDGLDKTGKSTLAKFLSEKTGLPIKKFSAPGPMDDPAVDYIEFLMTGEPSIIDRCWLSEMAYGPVFRGESTVDLNMQRVIEGISKNLGVKGVYCYADRNDLVSRFKQDDEDFVQPEQISEIVEGFDRALATSHMEWIRYTVGDDMESVYEQVR